MSWSRPCRPVPLLGLGLLLAALLAALLGAAAALPAGAAAPVTSAGLRPHAYTGSGIPGYGNAGNFGSPASLTLNEPVTAMAATPDGKGYWLASADGGVFTYGDAGYLGSAGSFPLTAPVVALAGTPDGKGYWLGALDGGIFAFGDAGFHGSMGGHPLNLPITAMASTPDGRGYWLVASDGGIFAFGDAPFLGSMGGHPLNQAIVAMAATPDGKGYWLVAFDGGIFAFGDAGYYGSMGGQPLNNSVVSMASTPDGKGYWLASGDGGVFTFGDAGYHGNGVALPDPPVTAIVATPDGGGYWLLSPDDWNVSFSTPSLPESPRSAALVADAAGQVGGDPLEDAGNFCNPYGPCEPWCALFATSVWEDEGIPIPRYAFTGDIDVWAQQHTSEFTPGDATVLPGDAILYGTGPSSTATSFHVGIVAQVWPDGAVITVEGDAGPAPNGQMGVIVNGPFLPQDSPAYNDMPVYAFATP